MQHDSSFTQRRERLALWICALCALAGLGAYGLFAARSAAPPASYGLAAATALDAVPATADPEPAAATSSADTAAVDEQPPTF